MPTNLNPLPSAPEERDRLNQAQAEELLMLCSYCTGVPESLDALVLHDQAAQLRQVLSPLEPIFAEAAKLYARSLRYGGEHPLAGIYPIVDATHPPRNDSHLWLCLSAIRDNLVLARKCIARIPEQAIPLLGDLDTVCQSQVNDLNEKIQQLLAW